MFDELQSDRGRTIRILGPGAAVVIVMGSLASRIGVVPALFCAGIAAIGILFGVESVRLQLRAKDWNDAATWPVVTGHVENVNVRERRRKRRPTIYLAEFWYSYPASGNHYSGGSYRIFDEESRAWAAVDAVKGKVIRVKYNPKKPEVSCFAGLPESSEAGDAWLPEVLLDRFLAKRY